MKNLINTFSVNIPEGAKNIANMVGNDIFRPQMTYVVLNPDGGYIAASDTHKLQMVEADFSGGGKAVGINPKDFAKMVGHNATFNVYSEEIITQETQRVGSPGFARYVTTDVKKTYIDVMATIDGAEFTTRYEKMHFPDFKRVIPRLAGYGNFGLSPANVKALSQICKLHKNAKFIKLAVDGNTLAVVPRIEEGESVSTYRFAINNPNGGNFTFGLNPKCLIDCLKVCDGTIMYNSDGGRPVYFGNSVGHVIMMPNKVDDAPGTAVKVVESAFADDAAEIARQIADKAAEIWSVIIATNKNLQPGNYTAADLKSQNKAKCGFYAIPDECGGYNSEMSFSAGNISVKVKIKDIFAALNNWQSFAKIKPIFAVGNCVESVADVVIFDNESKDAKTAKTKLRELGGGWYVEVPSKRVKGYDSAQLFHNVNGTIVWVTFRPWGSVNDEQSWSAFAEKITTDKVIDAMLKADEPYWAKVAQLAGITETAV